MSNLLLTGVSVIGPGHLVDNTPNQDSFATKRLDSGFVLVVCDGMGSKPLSHLGSALACRAVLDIVSNTHYSTSDREVVEAVYKRWLDLMAGIEVGLAVTTCLFCWADDLGTVRSFQLGDGLILARGTSGIIDHQGFSNETTGLGISKKYSDWKINQFHLDLGEIVVLMTDGISEDIENGCEQQILDSMRDSFEGMTVRRVKKALKKELIDWPTPNHLDDKTIAIAIR